jgi:hypothetical protein
MGLTVLPETPKTETVEILKEVKQFVDLVQGLASADKLREAINIKIRVVPRHRLHPTLFENGVIPAYTQIIQ